MFFTAVPEPNGVYLSDCQIEAPAAWAIDIDAAKKLYELSEKLVGTDDIDR